MILQRICAGLVTLVATSSHGLGEEFAWDDFSLPPQYSLAASSSSVISDQGASTTTPFHEDVVVDRDWVYIKKSTVIPGIGASVVELRSSSYDSSLLITPTSSSALISDRFAQLHGESGEASVTPMPVCRMLVHAKDLGITVERGDELPDGSAVYLLSGEVLGQDAVAKVVMDGKDIVSLTQSPPGNNRVVHEIKYLAWVDLPGGGRVPTEITDVLNTSGTGPSIQKTARLDQYTKSDLAFTQSQVSIPDGFAVRDTVAGTEYRFSSSGNHSELVYPAAASQQHTEKWGINRILVWGGVLLIGVSGIVVALKRKAVA
ncbi:MAG: hypothetical protein ACF8MF_07005 [Phycisphaerales bacterium JB052]